MTFTWLPTCCSHNVVQQTSPRCALVPKGLSALRNSLGPAPPSSKGTGSSQGPDGWLLRSCKQHRLGSWSTWAWNLTLPFYICYSTSVSPSSSAQNNDNSTSSSQHHLGAEWERQRGPTEEKIVTPFAPRKRGHWLLHQEVRSPKPVITCEPRWCQDMDVEAQVCS